MYLDVLVSVFSRLGLALATIYALIWLAALMMTDKDVDELAKSATLTTPGAPMIVFLALAIKSRKNKIKEG